MSRQGSEVSGNVVDLEAARARRGAAGGTEPWVRKDWLAEWFSVSPRSIERWVKRGMPHKKYGVILFQVGACERWLDEQR